MHTYTDILYRSRHTRFFRWRAWVLW